MEEQQYTSRLAAELAGFQQGLRDLGRTQDQIDAATEQFLNNAQEAYMPTFNIGEFEDLLGKLEGSKMKQAAQKGRIDRRGTMSQGLASMMSNF